jgi:hypothetical protein
MNSKKIQAKPEMKGSGYELDPGTRRSRFLKNNKAALIHGGFSKNIPEELLTSILSNDLGFELGVLKGQLTNITTMGMGVISELVQDGENTTALNIALSCADRSAKLVPQIQKILESVLVKEEQDEPKVIKTRTRLLKKLHAGLCLPSEVAYQFECHQLGELPDYVDQMLKIELKEKEPEVEIELYSREELQVKVSDYWQSVEQEKEHQVERKADITAEKERVNAQVYSLPMTDENNEEG